jgi:hypothetical protein
MDPATIIRLLGKPSTDNAVLDLLKDSGARAGPKLKRGDFDAYVEVPQKGLYFVFRDEAFYQNRQDAQIGTSPLILVNVSMYCTRVENYKPYVGMLPFGLLCSNGRDSVRATLGPPELSSDETRKDRWTREGVWLFVTYSGGFQSIRSTTVQLPTIE